jgi:hypothetical protein
LISLIYVHLLSEIIINGKGQKYARGAITGGQIDKCRTLEQELDVFQWYNNNEKM